MLLHSKDFCPISPCNVTYKIIAKILVFRRGSLPRGILVTHLILIPKKEGVTSLKDFCPISLCNVTYKIIAKILVFRLHSFLPHLILLTKAGLVPGHRAVDHVIVAKELFYVMSQSNRKKKSIAYKVDVENVY